MPARRMRRAAAAVLALASAACVESVPFTVIDQGEHSGRRDAGNVVIRDAAAWQALWAQHTAGMQPPAPIPAVDFGREMVVGVFLGERTSGGFALEVVGVERHHDHVSVYVRQTAPDPGGMRTLALTAPFQLIRLPASPLPVSFHTRLAA